MNRILKTYLKRLTNLSSRNKSLLLTRLPAEQFVDLHDTDFLLEKPSFEVLRQLIQRKARVPLCDVQDPRFDRVNELSRRLRKIARTERFIEEERGSRDLYVGYPLVRGMLSDGSVIRAPLLFFPVTLRQDREQWCLFGRDDTSIVLNRSFGLAYAYFTEVRIPDEVLEKSFDDAPTDALEFRTYLYEWLKETPFRLNFNQALFEDKLQAFEVLSSGILQVTERTGELKLYPEAVLGIFPQAGSYLVPDYNHMLEAAEAGTLALPLLLPEGPEGTLEVPYQGPVPSPGVLREEHILTPFPADVSQEGVIRAVKRGESVVVQGPPGTGKSQLICNLMADMAAQGKRVLLVCQKRAALDVVYQRLQGVGLGPFAALIHDFQNDRSGLYRQLATQIEQVDDYRQQNYSLDAVVLEREFTQESRQIDRIVAELTEFREALFSETDCGLSVKELYLTSDPHQPHVDMQGTFRAFLLCEGYDFRQRLGTYATYAFRLTAGHPWHPRRSFATYSLADLRALGQVLTAWPALLQSQKEQFETTTQAPFEALLTTNRPESRERMTDLLALLTDESTFSLFQKYLSMPASAAERLAFVRQAGEALAGNLAEGGLEGTLSTAELGTFRGWLAKALDAKAAWASGKWWDLFGENNAAVKQTAQRNGLSTQLPDLQRLDIKLRNRLELENGLQNPLLGFEPGYLNATGDFGTRYLHFFQASERAADAALRADWAPWRTVWTNLALNASSLADFKEKLNYLLRWLGAWEEPLSTLGTYLLPEQLRQMFEAPGTYAVRLHETLREDFDSLVEMDRLWEQMNTPEQVVTRQLLEAGTLPENPLADDVLRLFDNSLRLAWIEHLEEKYPVLRAVSSLRMQQWEEALQASIGRKQALSRDIVLMKLREAIYQNVENNRLGHRVTYREVLHQVTKKRKIWPVRKLLHEHAEEVFRLVPCWMASPEAVSALFPMERGLFDLVIFDEASQCYAEYGLPAAYRARQVVITGDSKQLPPSDLYRVRFEEVPDEESTVALEVDSLLGLAAQALVPHQLMGHYRSRSLDLIDFSNHHFYKSTLRLLPDFRQINDAEPGIRYLKVEGLWEQNTNRVEAERVVELVRELSIQALSVGVVTFNFPQQQLIQEMLESTSTTAKDLFVKNIENVQGDERDVIIFSVGYAPDARGRLVMQFGALNAAGGENRLNVAVTRARERIYVVTSLWPAQLQTDHTVNDGPKVLKAYLQYALEVSEGRYRPQPASTHTYRTDWLLKARLAKQHPNYHQELPFADLTVRTESTYEGLILTDDDLYYQSTSPKEPHAYLPLLLRQKHWPFRRVYSREYWRGQAEQGA